MANINLLPWREEAREQRKKDYFRVLLLVFLVSVLVSYLSLLVVKGMISEQKGRNDYLQSEINFLDKQIGDIQLIRVRKKDIERRTDIILNLQQARNLPTRVLDELVRVVPAGVYLSSIKKEGSQLLIEGRSESNNHVANMMRQVKASKWLQDPNMQLIAVHDEASRQLQRFILNVTVVNAAAVKPVEEIRSRERP
ncbi:PilN domain-containing protein [Shewanella surugensis]|uniref:PilN domain-containing protein n=1 Tax=Shewanella surugensis TaxID=212020 RepID=A0ABT0LE11_9GAMM|nr:PilN domain-containing protein [Shewanella surugensis]MCL1125560.1 PilN domain-containing protein [Shewanella surugensis]